MPTTIEQTSTVTAKGQTTVPKAVRQALGLVAGGKIAFRIEGGRITVCNADAERHDPALSAVLRLIESDIARGGNMRDLPPDLAKAMRAIADQLPSALDGSLEGDVAL